MKNAKGMIMKLKPSVVLVSLLTWQMSAFGEEGLDAYRIGEFAKAADFFQQHAPTNPDGQFALAEMYLYGYGLPKNNTKAIEAYTLAANQNYLPALQFMSRYELLVTNRSDEALKWFKKAAELKDIPSLMYCAAAYIYGLGVPKNEDIARKYYIEAAKLGDPLAQTTLAEHFFDAKHASNTQLAWLWLNKACAKNYAPALLLKSKLLHDGKNIAANKDEASTLLNQAISMNYLPAYVLKGQWAMATQQWDMALQAFKTALAKGYLDAQRYLGELYAVEGTSVSNHESAFLWMQKAADQGDKEAQKRLSDFYSKGEGVEADPQKAQLWLDASKKVLKSAEKTRELLAVRWLSAGQSKNFNQGIYHLKGIWFDWQNPQALLLNHLNVAPKFITEKVQDIFKPNYTLVKPYEIGLTEYLDAMMRMKGPVPLPEILAPHYTLGNDNQLTADAFKTVQQQAFLGVAESQFMLGQCYLLGVQVKADPIEARAWFSKAMDQLELRAQYELALLDLASEDEAIQKQGLVFLKDAAFKGNTNAEYTFGLLNEKGVENKSGRPILKVDIEQAKNMYRLASVNDSGMAKFRLAEWLSRESLSTLALQERLVKQEEISDLYRQAVDNGIEQAKLPLAFHEASSKDLKRREWAFNTAQEYANKGNQEAALLLGLMIDRQDNNPEHTQSAMPWYKQAKSHPIGGFVWGSLSPTSDKATEYLQKAADVGFSYANLNLAVLAHQHQQPSLENLQKAADMENFLASHLLANQLMLSDKKEDKQKSLEIFQKLAQKGDAQAQMKVGYMMVNGLGSTANPALGEQWLLQAAKQHHPEAEFVLGTMYHLGQFNGTANDEQAKYWFKCAAKKLPQAWLDLGFIYETVDKQYTDANYAYQQAIQYSKFLGYFNQGLIYQYGKGTTMDLNKAKTNFAVVAQTGSPQAMLELGDLNLYKGSHEAAQEALSWYQKASEKGQPEAFYRLGLMNESGIGTQINYPQAISYYQKAQQLGDLRATEALKRINTYKMSNGEPKHNRFVELSKYAASHFQSGHPDMSNAELRYLTALDVWNHGQVDMAEQALNQLVHDYPNFVPAKNLMMQIKQGQEQKAV